MKRGRPTPKTIKVWITKYALTRGIFEATVEVVGDFGYTQDSGDWRRLQVRMGREAFTTEEAAKANVVERIDRKIASIDKQRDKLVQLRAETRGETSESPDERHNRITSHPLFSSLTPSYELRCTTGAFWTSGTQEEAYDKFDEYTSTRKR